MSHYVILSRFTSEAFKNPKEIKNLATTVSDRIKKECPSVTWHQSFTTLGQYDVIDIIESDNQVEAERAALIIRSDGHSVTETMAARPWKEFLDSL